MGPGRRYYFQRRRVGGRIEYTYYGAGVAARLIAEIEQIERERRAHEATERQMARDTFADLVADPPELTALLAEARSEVARVLTEAGYRQHKRQWRKRRAKKDETG